MSLELCNECHLYRNLNEYGRCEKCEQDLIDDYENQKKEDMDACKSIIVEGLR